MLLRKNKSNYKEPEISKHSKLCVLKHTVMWLIHQIKRLILVTGRSYVQFSIPAISLDNDHFCLTETSLGTTVVEQGAGTVLVAMPPVVCTTKELVINSQSHKTAQLIPGTNQNTQENERTNCSENDHTAENKSFINLRQKRRKQLLSGKKLLQNYSFSKNKEGTPCMELFLMDCPQINVLQLLSWDPNRLSAMSCDPLYFCTREKSRKLN